MQWKKQEVLKVELGVQSLSSLEISHTLQNYLSHLLWAKKDKIQSLVSSAHLHSWVIDWCTHPGGSLQSGVCCWRVCSHAPALERLMPVQTTQPSDFHLHFVTCRMEMVYCNLRIAVGLKWDDTYKSIFKFQCVLEWEKDTVLGGEIEYCPRAQMSMGAIIRSWSSW